MLDTEKDGSAPSGAACAVPARTTFADGRMTTKEAWNYCRSLCEERGIEAPTLRTFKWHLRHGNHIQGERVRNPFNSSSKEKVLAVDAHAVRKFVDVLAERGDELRVLEQPAQKTDAKQTPAAPEKEASKKATSKKKAPKKTVEHDVKGALKYLRSKAGRGCELNLTTLRFYLAYDVIPSRFEGRQRLVRRDDLDAFLDLVPDAVYANHISYETEKRPDDLSMREAYAYYSDVEPDPVTLNTFRSLVAAGIIRPVRTSDDPKAPVLGFRRQEIAAFLALRQRILEKNSDTTATKAFLTRKANEREGAKNGVQQLIEEALERAGLPAEGDRKSLPTTLKKKKKTKAEASGVPERRGEAAASLTDEEGDADVERVSVKDAYAYYQKHCERPFTISWFRSKIANGLIFDALKVPDKGPKGHKYLVSLKSIDAHLATNPKGRTTPEYVAVETAYHRLSHIIPAHMTLLQFKRLVDSGAIKTSRRKGVVKVPLDAAREYFREHSVSEKMPEKLSVSEAHAYYSSRVSDPVAKPHFARWVYGGTIGNGKKEGGAWKVAVADVDAFVDEHPTGRIRANRNSRASRGTDKGDAPAEFPASQEASVDVGEERADETRVAVSIGDYSGPEELKEAIEMLTQQGFKVDVRP